jgi:nitroreductase
MEVLEAIRTRRSIRKYDRRLVPEEAIKKILEAGRWAPSANNAQPWTFIVLKDERVRKDVARATSYGKFLAEAPLGIAVVIDPAASTHPVEDGAIATQNMILAAHALGLGTCWIGSYGSAYEERVKEILGIPKGRRLLSIVSVGFPAESPKSTRRELGKLVFKDRYGKK